MGHNRAGDMRKASWKRRRREVRRFVESCVANAHTKELGKPPADFRKAIRDFAEYRQ